MKQHDTPAKVASTDGLGVASEAHRFYPDDAFFPAGMLAKATLQPWEEAMAVKGICPKCSDSLERASEVSGMRFMRCMGCRDVFVVGG